MLTSGHLIILLAAAACQVDLSASDPIPGQDTSHCPIKFFGRIDPLVEITNNGSHWIFCTCETNVHADYLYVEDPEGYRATAFGIQEVTKADSPIYTKLPNIRGESHCRNQVDMMDQNNRTRIQLLAYEFGPQSAFYFKPTSLFKESQITVSASVNGEIVYHNSIPRSEWKDGVLLDFSACRSGKNVILPGSEVDDPKTCSKMICDQHAVLTVVETCEETA